MTSRRLSQTFSLRSSASTPGAAARPAISFETLAVAATRAVADKHATVNVGSPSSSTHGLSDSVGTQAKKTWRRIVQRKLPSNQRPAQKPMRLRK